MSSIVAVHSFRGGTGKTNLTANLAALAVRGGKRVAVVDTDIQSPGIHVPLAWQAEPGMRTLNDYLWGDCTIEAATYAVAEDEVGPGLFLVPASLSTAAITRVLREGFDVGRLNAGFRKLIDALALDVLFVDTHPGLNPETLLSVAVSDVMVVLLRPDQQDFQGTSVTIEVARRLDVPRLAVVVNKVPEGVNLADLEERVATAYGAPVLAVLPHSDSLMRLSSAGLYALRYPDDPFTATLTGLSAALVAP